MAERLENDGGQMEAASRRPLWVAALAALLTAALLTLIGILSLLAYETAGCERCIGPPTPLTFEWWAGVARKLPYVAFVAVAYAMSLTAIIFSLEHRAHRPRLLWPLAGILAMVPVACIWIVWVATGVEANPAWVYFLPIACMAVIGMISGAVAGAARKGPRA